MNTMLMKILDCLSHLNAFMNTLQDKTNRNPATVQFLPEPTNCIVDTKVESILTNKDDNVIHPLSLHTAPSSKASDDGLID